MRIGLLSDRFPPDVGGLAQAAARIARELARAGCEVEVLASEARLPPGTLREEESDGVRVRRLGAARDAAETQALLFERLVARHRERPFDGLHGLYLVRSGFLAAYAGRYLGVPSVVSARGNDLDRAVHDPARAAHVLRALELASRVTAVSEDLGRKARALAPNEARVDVVPNGVDTTVFRPVAPDAELAETLGLDGRAVIGFAGELRHKKGLTTLLPALALLAGRRPVTLLAIGEVRDGEQGFVELFRRRHPEVRLCFVPTRPAAELPPLYALMDVFVHPSLRDGMPNALLEALACARPAVASAVGGIPDVLGAGNGGVLVAPGDPQALAAALEGVLADPLHATAMGAAGRSHVASRFTPEREASGYLSIYRELQADPRRGRAGVPVLAAR
jgi:glycosyltransferase involved in cell wall biosynthesis